jgi:hypothetical protein
LPKAEATSALKTQTKSDQAVRTFVLDTSVLLSDPKAMFRFEEHEVVIPIVVINELEIEIVVFRTLLPFAEIMLPTDGSN